MQEVVCVSDIACIEFPSGIPCHIDLVEPFQIVNGERIETALKFEAGLVYDLVFKYKVGVPQADAFHLFFYPSPEAQRAAVQPGADPTVGTVTLDQPMLVSWTPTAPVDDATGIQERVGIVRVDMPTDMDETYYGILAMSRPMEAN